VNNIAIISGTSNEPLSKNIASCSNLKLHDTEICHFPDSEIMIKINDDVRGKDCFVIQPTCPDVNTNLMELLIIIDCLRRASAERITAVIPYFGYARQDRKSEGRTPITAKLVANLLDMAGADRILTIDLHAMQIEGFFDIPVDHLRALQVFVNYLQEKDLSNTVILSPDVGNMKIASMYAEHLNTDIAVIDKRRINSRRVETNKIIGEVEGKDILIIDDVISTAGTVYKAASLAQEKGAKNVKVIATHGLFSENAAEKLLSLSNLDEIIVTDTIPLTNQTLINQKVNNTLDKDKSPKITILSVADLLKNAIVRIHKNESVSVLLEPSNWK